MSLYLPPWVVERRRREFEAAVLRNVTVEDPRAREYTRLLQQVHPDLFMVKARDKITDDVPLRPGFYHVLKRNPDAPLSVLEVHENGRYCEPDSRVFDRLAAGNLRERRVRDELDRRDRAEQDRITRDRARRDDDRRAHLREAVNAAVRAQVSMSRDRPWSQNVAGRRGARR